MSRRLLISLVAGLGVACLGFGVAAAQMCHPIWHPCDVAVYLPLVLRDPTPLPTATPTPTSTPLPTATPAPTKSAAFRQLTGQAVVEAFHRAGLEAEGRFLEDMSKRGIAPKVCDGWRFLIPSLGPDNGGRVYDCPDQRDLDLIAGYHESVCEAFPSICPHWFVRANVLVMINCDLDEDAADRYRAVLDRIVADLGQ